MEGIYGGSTLQTQFSQFKHRDLSLSHLFHCSPALHNIPFKNMGPYRFDQLSPELQAIASDNFTFQNWAKTFKCSPELLFEPTTEEQVRQV